MTITLDKTEDIYTWLRAINAKHNRPGKIPRRVWAEISRGQIYYTTSDSGRNINRVIPELTENFVREHVNYLDLYAIEKYQSARLLVKLRNIISEGCYYKALERMLMGEQ